MMFDIVVVVFVCNYVCISDLDVFMIAGYGDEVLMMVVVVAMYVILIHWRL